MLKAVSNIVWLFGDKLFRAGVGLFVGVWVARFLGPDQFGLLSFSIAFVSLFGAIAALGLPSIAVREFVKAPKSEREILGTCFILQLFGGLLAFLLILSLASLVRPDDALGKTIITIVGLRVLFVSGRVIKYWFESKIQSKYTVWAENFVLILVSALKVVMILSDAPLIAFAWATFIESSLVFITLFVVYMWNGGNPSCWKPKLDRGKALIRDSWPLVLSGIAITVYMKIDQIMLGQMIDNESVGLYSVAVRISEVWYFIPLIIVGSVFPAIIDARNRSGELYKRRMQGLYDLMVLLTLVVALPMTFLSSFVIVTIFGTAYAAAGPVLSVHIWAALFVFLGVVSSRWLLLEGRQMLSFQRTLFGAFINVVLNLAMIPSFGIMGAAYATVISYMCVGIVYDMFRRETREVFWMKAKAFNLYRSILNINTLLSRGSA